MACDVAGGTGAFCVHRAFEVCAFLECEVRQEVDAGDHTFFVGEVVGTEEGEPGPALVYREHTYVSAGPT